MQPVGVGDFNVDTPLIRQFVTWQSAYVDWLCPGGCSYDAVRNATFGRIKAPYR